MKSFTRLLLAMLACLSFQSAADSIAVEHMPYDLKNEPLVMDGIAPLTAGTDYRALPESLAKVAPTIVDALRTTVEPEVAVSLSRSVALMGPSLLPAAFEALRSNDPEVPSAAESGLRILGMAPGWRTQATEPLQEKQRAYESSLLPVFAEAIKNDVSIVRAVAAYHISRFRLPRDVVWPILLGAMDDPVPLVRRTAQLALIKGMQVESPSQSVSYAAADCTAKEISLHLVDAFMNGDSELAEQAEWALRAFGPAPAEWEPEIRAHMIGEDEQRQAYVLRMLKLVPPEQVEEDIARFEREGGKMPGLADLPFTQVQLERLFAKWKDANEDTQLTLLQVMQANTGRMAFAVPLLLDTLPQWGRKGGYDYGTAWKLLATELDACKDSVPELLAAYASHNFNDHQPQALIIAMGPRAAGATPKLLEWLESPTANTPRDAAEMLAACGTTDDAAFHAYLKAVEAKNYPGYNHLATCLSRCIKERPEPCRAGVETALRAQFDKPDSPSFHDDPDKNAAACYIKALMDNADGIPDAVADAVEAKNRGTRVAAMNALSERKLITPALKKHILARLRDSEENECRIALAELDALVPDDAAITDSYFSAAKRKDCACRQDVLVSLNKRSLSPAQRRRFVTQVLDELRDAMKHAQVYTGVYPNGGVLKYDVMPAVHDPNPVMAESTPFGALVANIGGPAAEVLGDLLHEVLAQPESITPKNAVYNPLEMEPMPRDQKVGEILFCLAEMGPAAKPAATTLVEALQHPEYLLRASATLQAAGIPREQWKSGLDLALASADSETQMTAMSVMRTDKLSDADAEKLIAQYRLTEPIGPIVRSDIGNPQSDFFPRITALETLAGAQSDSPAVIDCLLIALRNDRIAARIAARGLYQYVARHTGLGYDFVSY